MKKNDKILIVEDERAVARGLIYSLENEGFEVLWAETGGMDRHDCCVNL